MFTYMIGVVEEILDLFFPPRCCLCRTKDREKICARCRAEFRYLEPPFCRCCGNLLENEGETVCDICAFEKPPYSHCYSVLYYTGKVREALLLVKYKRQIELTPILAEYLLTFINENKSLFGVDLLVPVPKGNISEKIRSNAAASFCALIKQKTNLPMEEALQRTKLTKPQHTLDVKERWENVKDAFSVKPGTNIQEKKILLLDDIFTTGATITNCAKALKNGEAAEVIALTLTRAVKMRS